MERSMIFRTIRMLRPSASGGGLSFGLFLAVLLLGGLPGAGFAETQEDAEASPRRVVIRTTADGKVEVVHAEKAAAEPTADDKAGQAAKDKPAKAQDSKDRAALEAMAQRLWVADSAQQSLQQTKAGKAGPRAPGSRSATGRDGGAVRLQSRPASSPPPQSGTPQSSAAAQAAAGLAADVAATPCLAASDEVTAEDDPCEVARRIGRLQPCRTPKECAAYDAWRRQYGAPGLRAAAPKGDAAAKDQPKP